MAIVAAQPAHLPALAAIELAAAALFPPADLPPALRGRTVAAATLAAAQHDGRLWVATGPDGRVLGFALAGIVDGHWHLDEMDVHPDHAGQGLGARLLRRMLEAGAGRGFERATLTTFAHLPWNAPFYRRHGFAELPPSRCGPALTAQLEAEQATGLTRRIAMVRPLP
ncbi:hypothetical protein GCM10007350_24360 [Jeongeupia chitinilytica]|uniref:N-acetyltransferase domain-containing protein n=1 Tax=Jeongeupia chitinilytica TaxID=1041641 RepID=A0ABQ3H3M9_9NEIS|nr:hypothetical protein GCM10007350_24360 [Jeongeupia chitinilytica]